MTSPVHKVSSSLWVDAPDAHDRLRALARNNPDVAANTGALVHFIDRGYAIIERSVEEVVIDRFLACLQRLRENPNSGLLASVPADGPQDSGIVKAFDADADAPLTKILDSYALDDAGDALTFNAPALSFLRALFLEDPVCFQTLYFTRGSTQAIHQDTAYVVVEREPFALAASWIALEDIQEGSGELIYYEGSHRLPDFIYEGKRKHFDPQTDPHEHHLAHLESLHTKSRERGFPLRTFRPRKGDMLIWHADLAHGGGPIADSSLTRLSLVSHYTGVSRRPRYTLFLPPERHARRRVRGGGEYLSLYYQL